MWILAPNTVVSETGSMVNTDANQAIIAKFMRRFLVTITL